MPEVETVISTDQEFSQLVDDQLDGRGHAIVELVRDGKFTEARLLPRIGVKISSKALPVCICREQTSD